MNRVCLLCDRIAPKSALFCQEPACQAERAPLVLSYGDRFGDVEIVRPLVTLRSSVVYAAIHLQQQVLLKVAHPGADHEQRLVREAELLHRLQVGGQAGDRLPNLLQPYTRANARARLVGRAMLADRLVSYTLFAHVPGEPLTDLLKKHSQLWIDHIGWITVELASAVALIHGAHHLHLALGAEAVLVHFAGDQAVPRVTLIDLGLAATLRQTTDNRTYAEHWYPAAVRPGATAPELAPPRPVSGGVAAGTATDVYGLGLVLYELLAGAPPFPRTSIATDALTLQNAPAAMRPLRRADVQPIADLALQMLDRNPARRPPDARAVINEITGTEIGSTPTVRTNRWPAPERIFRIAAIMLTLAFAIALALSLREFFV